MPRLPAAPVSFALVLLGLHAVALPAQHAAADEVRTRYAAAVGGRAALDTIRSIRLVSVVELPERQSGYEIDVVYDMRGRVASRKLESGDVSIFDGTDAWQVSRTVGTRKLDGPERDALVQGADWLAQFRPVAAPASARVDGRTTFASKPATALVITAVDGTSRTEFYDPATHLLLGSRGTVTTPVGPMEVETVIEEYRRFSALTLPAKAQTRVGAMQVVTRTHTVVYNRATDRAFEVPQLQAAPSPGPRGRPRPPNG